MKSSVCRVGCFGAKSLETSERKCTNYVKARAASEGGMALGGKRALVNANQPLLAHSPRAWPISHTRPDETE